MGRGHDSQQEKGRLTEDKQDSLNSQQKGKQTIETTKYSQQGEETENNKEPADETKDLNKEEELNDDNQIPKEEVPIEDKKDFAMLFQSTGIKLADEVGMFEIINY